MHKFLLSFKLNGEVRTTWVEGINLRHAKDKLVYEHEDATDVIDWTDESEADINQYIQKENAKSQSSTKSLDIL